MKPSAQFLDMGFVESAFLVQDFGDNAFRAKDGGFYLWMGEF